MASDTRVSDIDIDSTKYFADCGHKTIFLEDFRIGISFFGIGYFADKSSQNNQLFPITHFIPKFINGLDTQNAFSDNVNKLIENIRQIDIWDKCHENHLLSGFIFGFDSGKSYFAAFNTCHTEITICIGSEPGTCFEKNDSGIKKSFLSPDRSDALKIINSIMTTENIKKPFEVGGPTDILELTPDGKARWINDKPHIEHKDPTFHATFPDCLVKVLKADKKKYNLTSYID